MKSKALIFFSALALMVLLVVQYIFITQTYDTKKDLVDARYKGTIRSALSEFSSREISFAFDSVLFILDNLAVEYLYGDPDTLAASVVPAFQSVLDGYEEEENFVRKVVLSSGLSSDFDYHMQIQELSFTDLDFEVVIPVDSSSMLPPSRDALLVGSHTHARNFFRLTYFTYVDIENHTALVLKEMRLILLLTLVMLVLVFSVFFLTLRNMLRQKRLSEMKTDFINNMTHELKTPLSTISVASSSLGNKALISQQDKVAELSSLIKKQNRHLTDLIDRILDINIWERDQVRLRKEHTEIGHWLDGQVKAFRLKHPEVELDYQLSLAGGAPESMELDEVHLSTALNNLLSNAVKYGNDPIRIDFKARLNARQLSLVISDNGPGIKREEQKHLFEKFYRGQVSKTRVIRGLGLGLYYVKQIVEAHGGHVAVKSEMDSGASFTLIIPIQDGHTTG